MRLFKILAIASLFFVSLKLHAEETTTTYNPFTGKADYITRLSTNSIVAGTGITVTTTTKGVQIEASGGGGYELYPSSAQAILTEGAIISTITFADGTTQFSGVYGSTVDACMMYLDTVGKLFNKGTETLVPYTVSYFEHGCTNSVSGSSITINTAGTYLVVAQAGNLASASNTQITTAIYVNGTRQTPCIDQANAVTRSSLRCSAILDLNVGDKISQYFLMTGTGSQTFAYGNSDARCMLAVVRAR